ncbi:hypothetical protein H632_c2801p0 [Helicosporidium sp. ATCC 50920]|nr:hypothetical protein H632_c2801p0 [Helicosporidium sp. ATCC 50920]|eukprot:KDD72863.1 hypothetical protein H632_c2801p0 [Helicosporidium sp. ATCC 50920]
MAQTSHQRPERRSIAQGGYCYYWAPPKPKKGHRHDREKAERLKNIQDKLANMDGRIAQHRAARRELKGNAIDMLLLTPKLMRQKMKAGN